MSASRLPIAALLLLAFALPARAEGIWVLRPALGESISGNGGHGSAVEAQLAAEVKKDLWLGMETGLSYVQLSGNATGVFVTDLSGAGRATGSLTDGITRNREFFLGPVLRWGSTMYAIASYGLADVVENGRGSTSYMQGGSLGLGLGGAGRFEPSAELRYRWVADSAALRPANGVAGAALTFTVGVSVR